ncbi:MAG: hypothetical protein ACREKE_04475 [bacterium]
MNIKKCWMALALVCLAPLFLGACSSMNNTGPNLLGVVKLGPFPKQPSWASGYNLYFNDKLNRQYKGFQKINDEPILGGTSLMVPYLKTGKTYYFYMTATLRRNPSRETGPGQMFARKAQQSWN